MRNIILIVLGLLFLTLWLIIGYPLEINNLGADRVVTILFSILIAVLIFLTFRLVNRLKRKVAKIAFLTFLISISTIYALNGLWTYLISYEKGPVWEDRQIYTNQKGQKVISQFRETSGSIYDYRERLILRELSDKNRVSIEWTKKLMHGIWEVKDIKTDSVYNEDFDKERNENTP